MAERFWVGLGLGVLIGIVSGFVLVLLLREAMIGHSGLKSNVSIVSELLAIPTFWFGGSWVTTVLAQNFQVPDMLVSYVVTLMVVFTGVSIYPLVRLIIVLGNEIEQSQRPRT